MPTYKFPHPAVTTDIVIFTISDLELQVLLIKRGEAPHRGKWALPGGFLQMDETLDACALRELKEETGVEDVYLEQLYTFGSVKRDPRERVVSVAYFALIPSDQITLNPTTDAIDAKWFKYDSFPDLAFDHNEIISTAFARLKDKVNYTTIAMQFMPKEFTLTELQSVYECVLKEKQDKRNFRKSILALDVLKETQKTKTDGPHRPAKLYKLKKPGDITVYR